MSVKGFTQNVCQGLHSKCLGINKPLTPEGVIQVRELYSADTRGQADPPTMAVMLELKPVPLIISRVPPEESR